MELTESSSYELWRLPGDHCCSVSGRDTHRCRRTRRFCVQDINIIIGSHTILLNQLMVGGYSSDAAAYTPLPTHSTHTHIPGTGCLADLYILRSSIGDPREGLSCGFWDAGQAPGVVVSKKAAKVENSDIAVSVKDSSSRIQRLQQMGVIVALPERSVMRTDWSTRGGVDVVQLKSPRM